MSSSPYQQNDNAYHAPFSETFLPDEDYELFNLSLPDDKLDKMLIDSLDADASYWNQAPWRLRETDEENVKFFLGEQLKSKEWVKDDNDFVDNRLFSSVRAILSYATGQLAVPEVTPSRSDKEYTHMARMIESALYQHSLNENVDQKVRAAVANLILRKRGYLKQRFDPNAGLYGDIITEVVNPEDIIIDRTAGYLSNPNKIYHRVRCSIDELIARFPNKEKEILTAYSIKQGRFSQMSKYVTYFECWFTYMDNKNIPREGVCWFIPDKHLILDKQPNPNWIYSGNDQQDKQENVTVFPPKPFTSFNYLNLGHSFIDETCLFEQGRPMQELLNKRQKQFHANVDYMNGRWIASKKAFSEEDAQKLVNKGARTVAMTKAEDVRTAMQVLTPTGQPQQVFQSIIDARGEIDQMMGTPSIFKGADPQNQDTLGRDMMVKQQAGMLQDDLVRAVSKGMENYYALKLQMMRVYYTDDYWFQVKGGDGKFDFVMLNGDVIDSNVKIGVQVDSTLPLDKQMIRANAMGLAKMRLIDPLTLFEDMGLPNPEIRTERLQRSLIDPFTYLKSIEEQMDDNDAEVDIMMLVAGKDPQERDNYDESYLSYFNHFLTTNRFAMLPQDSKQRVVSYLTAVQHLASQSANLQGAMLDDAGILEQPVQPPMPKRDIRIVVPGAPLDAQQTSQLTGAPAPAAPPVAPPPVAPQAPTGVQ